MKTAYVVQGLGFGDEGKGSIVDKLVRATGSTLVVRYNGGPQAAHHVVCDDGRWHSFHQFGAGTFAGARTHLSRYMLVEPFALRDEALALSKHGVLHPFGRLSLDPRCVVVTPYHQVMNRLREVARGAMRHGSCGMGVGEAVSDMLSHSPSVIRVSDLHYPDRTRALLEMVRLRKMLEIEDHLLEQVKGEPLLQILTDKDASAIYAYKYERLVRSMTVWRDDEMLSAERGDVVFEGAQGVLLDERYGFAPHNTWSNTTFVNAVSLCNEVGRKRSSDVLKIGVLRSYYTRHGAGPFPTERTGFCPSIEAHNTTGEWQGAMRSGPFDMVLARYALHVCSQSGCPVDALAVTHLDCVAPSWPVCNRYEQAASSMSEMVRYAEPVFTDVNGAQDFLRHLEDCLSLRVIVESYGPAAQHKIVTKPITHVRSSRSAAVVV